MQGIYGHSCGAFMHYVPIRLDFRRYRICMWLNLDCQPLYLRRVSRCTVGSTYYCCDEDCWYYKKTAACGDDCCSVLNNTTEYCSHLWWTVSKITVIGVGFVVFCFICNYVFSCLASCCCK